MRGHGHHRGGQAGRRVALAVLGLAALPLPAQAHTSIQGVGDFIGGLLHPVVTPGHVLLLLGLGLLAGRVSPPPLRWPMRCFLPLSALGLAATGLGWVKALHPAVLHGAVLVVGGLLAWGRPVSMPALCGLFAFAGVALGLDSAAEASAPGAILKTLAGTWLGLGVVVYDVAIYASLGAATSWLRHALRIAGAWLLAIAVLMLAFALRPPAG
jgi:urease accessory protein